MILIPIGIVGISISSANTDTQTLNLKHTTCKHTTSTHKLFDVHTGMRIACMHSCDARTLGQAVHRVRGLSLFITFFLSIAFVTFAVGLFRFMPWYKHVCMPILCAVRVVSVYRMNNHSASHSAVLATSIRLRSTHAMPPSRDEEEERKSNARNKEFSITEALVAWQ